MFKIEMFDTLAQNTIKFIQQFTSESFNLVTIVLLHIATFPTLMAAITSITDRMPTVEIFLFLFAGLFVMLLKSIAAKEVFSVVINSFGFFVQVVLLCLVVFK
jgi:hypothetical protein